VFFTAFNLLEASLPSLVSRIAPAEARGSAMGVFSTFQFLGAFLGGMGGGVMHQFFGVSGVYLFCALVAGVWLALVWGMVQPRQLSNQVISLGEIGSAQAPSAERALLKIPGVEEAVVVVEEGVAYLKVDTQRLDWARLQAFGAARV
jgi:MFS family permease